MAESPEPERPAAAAGGAPLDGEDEEREPLLPRIAWAQPRRSAPGSAVRMVEAARLEGAASLSAMDEKRLFGPQEAPCCPCADVGLAGSLTAPPRDSDRSLSSGAPRPPRPFSPGPPARRPRLSSPGHPGACPVRKAGRRRRRRASRPGPPPGTRRCCDPDTVLALLSRSRGLCPFPRGRGPGFPCGGWGGPRR